MRSRIIILGSVAVLIIVVGAVFWYVPPPFHFGEADSRPSQVPTVNSTNLEIVQITNESTPTSASQPLPTRASIADVPFMAQAPAGDWADPRQQDGCEEAASIIAMAWARGQKKIASPLDELLTISRWQEDTYGGFHDTSAEDTVARILKGYFNYQNVTVIRDITLADIQRAIADGQLVLIPMDGQRLDNPHFTAPGPERHMVVVIGYDSKKQEIITNDPGTRSGKGYRYNEDIFFDSIRDYPTGYHEPITGRSKVMIVVKK